MSPTRTMERSSKLAPLTLVSKYYPVANYSYPRSEGAPTPCNSRSPSYKWSREDFFKRSSVDSQPPAPSPLSSPPSLVDDRTDSEASADVDDYRYHTHANELWDSFWMSEQQHQHQCHTPGSYIETPSIMAAAGPASAAPSCSAPDVPEKDYPALISSPQRPRRRPQGPRSQGGNGWPLSDQQPQVHQPRRASPTYSAFPKIVDIPSPPRTSPCSSSQLPSGACEGRLSGMDARRPLQQAPSPHRPISPYSRPGSPHPRAFSPASLKAFQRPATSHSSRPSSPMDYPYPSPPPTAPLPALPTNCLRAPHLTPRSSNLSQHSHTQQQPQPPSHTIRPYKSTTQLRRPPPEPLPVSVFEYDSDTDCTDDESSPLESPALSFFRFHRRSQSPKSNDDIFTRRRGSASKVVSTAHQSLIDATEKENCKRRKRTNTIDGLPRVVKQSDVFSRMLGLRGR